MTSSLWTPTHASVAELCVASTSSAPASASSSSAATSALPSPTSELNAFDLEARSSSRASPDTSVDGEQEQEHEHDNGPLPLSPIVLGGGVFGAQYSPQEYLCSEKPARVIELAFENGINAIDTSPFYGVSETVIGKALASPSLAANFPRHSYHIITKCGRYGANKRSFDYSPDRIRRSVQESLKRLNTTYLDAVYLHDVEFVADEIGDSDAAGYPLNALREDTLEQYGLGEGSAGRICGEGDAAILQAFATLLQLKSEGLIRRAGMAAYPLPTLLRLSRLIKHHLGPVDIVQSYSHYCLQNSSLSAFVPHLRAAGVQQIMNASPLNMGLLSARGAQDWHLAPPALRNACKEANLLLTLQRQTTLQAVALGFGLHSTQKELQCHTVAGCTEVEHVYELLDRWKALYAPLEEGGQGGLERLKALTGQKENENLVRDIMAKTGYLDWSWRSPPPFEEAERSL